MSEKYTKAEMEARWDDLSNYKDCPLCDAENSLFVDFLEEHNNDMNELRLLRSENERLRRVAKHGKRIIDEIKRMRVGICGDHAVYANGQFDKIRIDKYSEEIDKALQGGA